MNTELIARLEAAEVGSRELDASICVLLQYGGPNSDGATNVRTDGDWEGDLLFEQGSDECCNPIPAVTTSLDAALALAKSVLPSEAMWNISHLAVIGGKDFYFCDLYLPETGPEIDTSGDGWSPSLAVCAAILRALDAQEQK